MLRSSGVVGRRNRLVTTLNRCLMRLLFASIHSYLDPSP